MCDILKLIITLHRFLLSQRSLVFFPGQIETVKYFLVLIQFQGLMKDFETYPGCERQSLKSFDVVFSDEKISLNQNITIQQK